MSPRKSAAEARTTRSKIIERAMAVASKAGLEGVTIGRLADDLGMSKAGVLGHFGTKEALQLATLAAASDVFVREVPARAHGGKPGLDRLLRTCDAWVDYLADRRLTPGGCFLTNAAAEFDGRPGPVRDAVAATLQSWLEYLAREVRRAVADGDLPAGTDVEQTVYELLSLAVGANQMIQLHGDDDARDRCHRAMYRLLGVTREEAAGRL